MMEETLLEDVDMSESPRNATLRQILLSLEEQAWDALTKGTGATFYGRTLAPRALMVFPSGVMTREQTLAALEVAQPWALYSIEDAQAMGLSKDSALLTYTARAQRRGEAPYVARMTTIFVRAGDGSDWQTAFHQQTPIPE
jgi:hypothetical protein